MPKKARGYKIGMMGYNRAERGGDAKARRNAFIAAARARAAAPMLQFAAADQIAAEVLAAEPPKPKPVRRALTAAQKVARNEAARDRRLAYPPTQAQKDARNARARALRAEKAVGVRARNFEAAGVRYHSWYNGANDKYKNATALKRAITHDNRVAGPYARSIRTYKPNKNDWPGIDDTGLNWAGKEFKQPVKWSERAKRAVREPTARQLEARERFHASRLEKLAENLAQQGGWTAKELRAHASWLDLKGRSKMSAPQLYRALLAEGFRPKADAIAAIVAEDEPADVRAMREAVARERAAMASLPSGWVTNAQVADAMAQMDEAEMNL